MSESIADIIKSAVTEATSQAKFAPQISGLDIAGKQIDDYKEKVKIATKRTAELEAEAKTLREAMNSLKDEKGVADLEKKVERFSKTMQSAKKEVEAFLIQEQLIGGNKENLKNYQKYIDQVANGYKTASQVITQIKADLNLVGKDGGAIGADMLKSMLATLGQISEAIDSVQTKLDALQTNGVTIAGGGTAAPAADSVVAAMEAIERSSEKAGDDMTEARKQMLDLLTAINAFANIDNSKLFAVSEAFKGMANIGEGSFGSKSMANLIDSVQKLQEISANGGAIQLLFDVKGIQDLKVSKTSLNNLATYLPVLSDRVKPEAIQGIFAADPRNGINNLKVSNAALKNLKEALPTLSFTNVDRIKELFAVDTSGINSLKVSKASITNVENLARAVQILREYNVDLTLKGDATEDLKAVAQNLGLTQEDAEKADTALKGVGNAMDETAKSANNLSTAAQKALESIDGIAVKRPAVSEFKKSISETLSKDYHMEAADIAKVNQALGVQEGQLQKVTAAHREYADGTEKVRHVSSVTVQTMRDLGDGMQKVSNAVATFNPVRNNEGRITGWDVSVSRGYEQISIAAQKAADAKDLLVKKTQAQADIERELISIGKLSNKASMAGVPDNDLGVQALSEYASKLYELYDWMQGSNPTQAEFKKGLADLKAEYQNVVMSVNDTIEAEKQLVEIDGRLADVTRAKKAAQDQYEAALNAGVQSDELKQMKNLIGSYEMMESVLKEGGVAQNDYAIFMSNSASKSRLLTSTLKDQIDALEGTSEAARKAAKAEAARVNQTQAKGTIATERGRVSGIINSATGAGLSDQDANIESLVTYTNLLDILENELESANLTQKEFNTIMGNLKSIFREPEIAVKNLTKALKEQQSHIAKSATVYKDIEQACQDYAKAAESTDANVRGAYDGIKKLSSVLDNAGEKLRAGTMTGEQYDSVLKDTSASLQEYRKVLDEAGYGTDRMSSKFAALAQQLTRFITPLYLARKAWQTIKDMANVVIELEDAFAQLQIVTGATDKELEEFYDTAANISATLGKSITDIAASIEVFSRLGYSLPDATTLAQYATVLSNVASVSTDEATTGLTSIIKGYNMHVEQAEHVSDVLVDIGQKYAVSAGEMMEAYQRAGAALAATNTSFDKSAALIAAANAAIQNSSTVGTALKTISARIRGSKSDLEELGEDTTLLADGFSKYAKELKAITGVDIMVEGTTNQFKDLYDIMDGIAGVWDQLTDTQQARAAEILGGTRQLQVIASIISNWGDAEKALVTAQESAGAAARANTIYMDTTTAHMNQFKAAFQDLSQTVIDSDLLKGVVDFGTGLLKLISIVSNFIKTIGGIPSVLGVIIGLLATFRKISIGTMIETVLGKVIGLVASLKTLSFTFSSFTGTIGLAITAFTLLNAAITGVNNTLKENREKAIRAGEAAANESTELTELAQKYFDLNEAGSLNEDTIAARDEIIEKLGLEQSKVKDLIKEYGSYSGAIKQATIDELNRQKAVLAGALAASKQQLTSDYGDIGKVQFSGRRGNGSSAQSDMDAFNVLNRAGYVNDYAPGLTGTTVDFGFGDLSNYQNILSAYERIHNMMDLLVKDGYANTTVYQGLYDVYTRLEEGVDGYNTALQNLVQNLGQTELITNGSPETLDDYMRLRDTIIESAVATDQFKNSTLDVAGAVDSFLAKQDGMTAFSDAVAKANDDTLNSYQTLLDEVKEKGIDLTKTVYGNIDMNNRQTMEWTGALVAQYLDELQSWGEDIASLPGTISTVMGGSAEYDGLEIAFSPILQTDEGPKLLSKSTVDAYIYSLLDQLESTKDEWTTEDFLKLDATGLEIEGQQIKNIIADVGETAMKTGEAMHYVGSGGALSMARAELYQLANQAYLAADGANALENAYSKFGTVKNVFDEVTNKLKEVNSVQDLVANGFEVSAEKAMELAAAYPQILDNATITADGQLLLNEETVNSFIEGKKGEIAASIDAKIADLEADKAALEAKRAIAVSQLEMAQQVANGTAEITAEQLRVRLENENKVAAELVAMGYDQATAYQAVLQNMSDNVEIFDGNVGDAAQAIAADLGKSAEAGAASFDANIRAMNTGIGNLIANAHQGARAIAAMATGDEEGAIVTYSGGGNVGAYTFNRTVTKKQLVDAQMKKIQNRKADIQSIIKQLNTDISGYTSAIGAINGQISALTALRNSTINGINNYKPSSSGRSGSGGGGGGGGGGSGSGSSSKEETWFEKQYKLHQHYVNMDKETQADFLKWLDKAYKKAYKEGIITLDEFYKYEEEVYKGFNQIKENAKSTFDALVDYRLKMLQKERENQKEELQNQLSDLKDFYDKQRDMLQKSQEEQKYLNEQAEKRQSVTDLKTEIARLQFDTSAWATKRRIELQQQLSDAEKDLQDFEDEHALAEALDALDAAYNAEEERINKEMEAIDDVLNDPDALYNQALKDIKGNTEDLFKAFLLFNKKYGDGKDDTVKSMWEEAFKNSEAYKKIFGSYYEDTKIGNYTGYKAPTTKSSSSSTKSSSSGSGSSKSSSSSSSSKSSGTPSNGQTVQVKTSATNFSPKSGSVRMASFVPGGQYTVYQTSGDEVLIGRNGVYTGWVYKKDLVGYKKGTKNAKPGLHRVNEEGAEAIFTSGDGNKYRMFSGGEKVLNAKATSFLYEFATAGAEILDKMKGSVSDSFSHIGTFNQPINISMGDIVIEGDTNQQTVSEIRRAQREQINDVLKSFKSYQITLYRGVKY